MKVIGHTRDGYILEAASWEISRLSDGSAVEKRSGHYGSDTEKIPVGTTFEVSKLIDHMHSLIRAEEKAKEGAGFLRAFAALLDTKVPELVAYPPEEKAKEEAVDETGNNGS